MSDTNKHWLSYAPQNRNVKGVVWKHGDFSELLKQWPFITLMKTASGVCDVRYSKEEHFQPLLEAESDLLNKMSAGSMRDYNIW